MYVITRDQTYTPLFRTSIVDWLQTTLYTRVIIDPMFGTRGSLTLDISTAL